MDSQLMHLHSWNRFVLRDLSVAPSLLGATHTWQMGGAKIELKLPNAEKINRDRNDSDPVGRLTSWLSTDCSPLEYAICQVDVRVFADACVELPCEVLNRAPNAFDLIPQAQQDDLGAVATRQRATAKIAYEYWLSVMRWVCDDYRIGRSDVVGNETGWATYLFERNSDTRVWGATQNIVIQDTHCVSDDEWQKAQEQVCQGAEMPIHLAQLHDAEVLFSQGDYRRCTIDLCIAAEIFLRQKIWASLPSTLEDDIRAYVEQAPIYRYLNQFILSLLEPEQHAMYKSELSSHLKELFKVRNDIMHSGARNIASHVGSSAHLHAVRSLFALIP